MTTRSRGKIIFTQVAGHEQDSTQYARWISTGDDPHYSIQRFTWTPSSLGVQTECKPYYRAYHNGFNVHAVRHTGAKEFPTFEDCAGACDRHFHINRSD